MNPILDCLRAHRTIRAYKHAALPRERILEAVRCAQAAATSSHVQPYCLIQVEDSAERERLAELSGGQQQVAEAGAFFVICADQRRFRAMARARDVDFAPNFESFLVGVVDASIFAQNLVVAFEALGYGTCYIGGLRTRLAEVDELLELPGDVFPLFGLCVGEMADDPGPKPRLAPEAVLFQSRYPTDDELAAQIAEYDARMATYYAERGLAGRNWSGGVSRKFSAEQRVDLFDYYSSRGANLR